MPDSNTTNDSTLKVCRKKKSVSFTRIEPKITSDSNSSSIAFNQALNNQITEIKKKLINYEDQNLTNEELIAINQALNNQITEMKKKLINYEDQNLTNEELIRTLEKDIEKQKMRRDRESLNNKELAFENKMLRIQCLKQEEVEFENRMLKKECLKKEELEFENRMLKNTNSKLND